MGIGWHSFRTMGAIALAAAGAIIQIVAIWGSWKSERGPNIRISSPFLAVLATLWLALATMGGGGAFDGQGWLYRGPCHPMSRSCEWLSGANALVGGVPLTRVSLARFACLKWI